MKHNVCKRALAVVLSLVLLLSVIPMVFAATAASGSVGSINWNLDSDGTLTISGSGEMPDSIRWSSADKVPWNEYASSISSIALESEVTSIGSYAFAGLKSVRNVTIPKTIKSIGFAAFEGCESLRSVTFAEGLKTIGDRAFNKCSRLSDVVIPKSVESIGSLAFNDCEYLRDITILNPACVISESDGEGNAIDKRANIHGFAGSTADAFAKSYHRTFTAMTEDDANSVSFTQRIRQIFSSLIPMISSAFSSMMESFSKLLSGQEGATIPGASQAEVTFANLIPYVQTLFRSLVTMLQSRTAAA